jgi:hypothetical protein
LCDSPQKRTNLAGADTNLTGADTNLAGADTNLAGADTNLTGAATNLTGADTNLTGADTNLQGLPFISFIFLTTLISASLTLSLPLLLATWASLVLRSRRVPRFLGRRFFFLDGVSYPSRHHQSHLYGHPWKSYHAQSLPLEQS